MYCFATSFCSASLPTHFPHRKVRLWFDIPSTKDLLGDLFIAKSIRTDSEIDGDDAVVYTWSRPEEAMKRWPKKLDGDDQVVYTWSRPDEHRKRSEKYIDGDDQVVYTWSRPEENKY